MISSAVYLAEWKGNMTDYNKILEISPFSLERSHKHELMSKRLVELSKHHYNNCQEYQRILDVLGYDLDKISSYYDLPMIPVKLFKNMELKSISDDAVVKTMTSSGTTGQSVSKIYLDRNTAAYQQKTLVKIMNQLIGNARLPMIILDCPSVVRNRAMFSARGAGILGFSIFASDTIYALDDNMKLNTEGLLSFIEKHKGKNIFMFGFTYMIWQHFYKELMAAEVKIDLSEAVLVHGGGWKKLMQEAQSPEQFKLALQDVCGIRRVHDYYGMVEQTGCIYIECEYGHLHASIFSDVITRRTRDFSPCDFGERGIIQVVSMIPESYPGHSLLTEDEGYILGEDDCPCGRKGKYFNVTGRVKKAEVRGCSDTYEQR
ncbi:MAG: hypothetical protein K0S04_1314 [Herbinix sp.]|jgi:phenylacetate-coenzyme A ligase PaaK-like adenylate-forming protein|nr:hypothetical protein [Herbinix sp.]